MFDNIKWKIGEIREDITTWTKYRYDGTTWNIDMSKSPTSAWFPLVGNRVGEIRTDAASWYSYKWSWSAWVIFWNPNDIDKDWLPQWVEDGSITTAMLSASCVTLGKTNITFNTTAVAINTSSVVVNIGTGKTILGVYPWAGLTTSILNVVYSGSTVTITLSWNTTVAWNVTVVYASY